MKKIICILFIATATAASGQECSCTEKFQAIKHEIETNYAGYMDKVNPANRKEFKKLTKKIESKIKNETNNAYCMASLYEWLEFFKDGHVQLSAEADPKNDPNSKDTAIINERIKNCEIVNVSPDKLKALANSTSYEEGLYYNVDSTYEVAVIKNSNRFRDYVGVIVQSKTDLWKPGQVKFELKKQNDSLYTTILYYRFHTYQLQWYYFDGLSFDGQNWNKVGKKKKDFDISPYKYGYKNVQAQKISDSTLYIQIGSFNISNKRAIDSVFTAYDAVLRSTPNLIIDLRGNGGGGDASYDTIIPYIYTDPLVGVGNEVYATPDNVIRIQKYLDEPDMPEGTKKFIRKIADSMNAHPGKFVMYAGDDTDDSYRPLPYPKKVVILMENHCASTTEQFLLAARQSKKVTLMGVHTEGVLDFSNILHTDLPCAGLKLGYSSTRSRRIAIGQGIDGVGIQPDIPLTYDKDWIEEARRYMEK